MSSRRISPRRYITPMSATTEYYANRAAASSKSAETIDHLDFGPRMQARLGPRAHDVAAKCSALEEPDSGTAPLQDFAVVAAVLCVVGIVDAEDFVTDVGLDTNDVTGVLTHHLIVLGRFIFRP
jgi:hypothetical protein